MYSSPFSGVILLWGLQVVTEGYKNTIDKHSLLYLDLVQEDLVHLDLIQERRFDRYFHISDMYSSLQFF